MRNLCELCVSVVTLLTNTQAGHYRYGEGQKVKKPLTCLGSLWIIVALIVTLHPGAPILYAQGPSGDAEADISIQNEAFELEVIRLVNLERISRGIHPLRLNADLRDAARAHNQDMITNNFEGHTGSDGSSPGDRACAQGYTPYPWGDCFVGENIGFGYSTPAAVVAGWMGSTQGHRELILNTQYREIGVGHAIGGDWGVYWTMDVGAQPCILPVFINNDEDETTSRQVTITLTKEDVSSWGSIGPITGVQISEDPSFAGATWQPWSQTVPFTLSSGNGTKTIYVRFTDGSTQVTSSDTITLNESVPNLSLSTSKITFLAEVGSGQTLPSTVSFDVNNDGSDVLHWTAGDDAGWLVLDSTSGDAPANVEVWVDNSGGILNSLGEHTATITVTATNPDAVNTPQTISVTLKVVEEVHTTYLPLILR